jgi:hypothetical protein
MSDNDRGCYLACWLSRQDRRELEAVARRLAYPSVEPLAVEIFRCGLQVLEQRYEPATRAGRFLAARESVTRPRRAARATRA